MSPGGAVALLLRAGARSGGTARTPAPLWAVMCRSRCLIPPLPNLPSGGGRGGVKRKPRLAFKRNVAQPGPPGCPQPRGVAGI